MDGQTGVDGWTERWEGGRMDGRMDGWTDRIVDGWTDSMHGWTEQWEHGRMDGWKDGWMDKQKNRWMDRQNGWMDRTMGAWEDGWKAGWMDRQKNRWMDRTMGGWKDGWKDGWMDRTMGGWTDGRTAALASRMQQTPSFLGKQVCVWGGLLPSVTRRWKQRKGTSSVGQWGHLPRWRTRVPEKGAPGRDAMAVPTPPDLGELAKAVGTMCCWVFFSGGCSRARRGTRPVPPRRALGSSPCWALPTGSAGGWRWRGGGQVPSLLTRRGRNAPGCELQSSRGQ